MERLVRHYRPERIILYGSHGTPRADSGSDLDLLVIKDTDKGLTERQMEVDLDDVVLLNSVYRGRYPTEEGLLPPGEPTPEETARAVRAAEAFMRELRALLRGGGERSS